MRLLLKVSFSFLIDDFQRCLWELRVKSLIDGTHLL